MILPTTDVAAREEAALVMKRFNPKRVAFLGDSRSLAAAANAVWKEQLTAAGVEIVADESFTEDDRDFTAQLTKVRDGNVDLVLYPAYYKYETVEIVKQSRKLGIDVPLVGFGQVCEEAMENLANSGHQNLFFVEEAFGRQLKESGNKFVASFTQRYGIRAAMEAAAGHAALVMVKDAIERGGYKAKDIRNALRSGQVNTAIGPVKYGKGGANTAAQFALSTLPQRMGAAIAQ
jgi:branched-chain amino acid transport system substrate-binding protein